MTALMGLQARLRLARLYLCTDARERQGDLAEFLAAALAGGVDVVQIRQPGLRPEVRRAALEVAREVAAPHQALVGVDGSPKIAGQLGVDLLHLDQAGPPTAVARTQLAPQVLVGRSAHDSGQTDAALQDDALDYLWIGPVRGTPAAAGRPAVGLDLVRHAARLAPTFSLRSKPWFAAGGITTATIEAVLEAGARRVCVAGAIATASDPQQTAAELAGLLQAAWRDDPAAERYTFAAAASTGRD
ncbi:MAG: thiamine phosphate synthase [Friedmanniella sp.]